LLGKQGDEVDGMLFIADGDACFEIWEGIHIFFTLSPVFQSSISEAHSMMIKRYLWNISSTIGDKYLVFLGARDSTLASVE